MNSTPQSLLADYVRRDHLVGHHIQHFNDFVTRGMQEVINLNSVISHKDTELRFHSVTVTRPTTTGNRRLLPTEARMRNLNYDASVYVNITRTQGTTVTEHTMVNLCKIPVMLLSERCHLNEQNKVEHGECEHDHGGYFIIKGKERVLVPQLRPQYNRIKVYDKKPGAKYSTIGEIRTTSKSGMSTILLQCRVAVREVVMISMPHVHKNIPAGLIFQALGGVEWSEFRLPDKLCGYETFVVDAEYGREKSCEMLRNITNMSADALDEALTNELFYYLNGVRTKEKNRRHLIQLVRKTILTREGYVPYEDKDNLSSKRLDTPKPMLLHLFHQLYTHFAKQVTNAMQSKRNPGIIDFVRNYPQITNGLVTGLLTGNWTAHRKSKHYLQGVSQVLARQNHVSAISHLRRINIPIGNEGKNIKMRQLHPSHLFFICPYETPEGQTVGTVLNMAIATEISIESDVDDLLAVVEELMLEPAAAAAAAATATVVVCNGEIVGSCADTDLFMRLFNQLRDGGAIFPMVSAYHDEPLNEIHLHSDGGRFMRHVRNVSGGELVADERLPRSFDEAVDDNIFVLRSACELERALIAMRPEELSERRYQYVEIFPQYTMFGIMAGMIPFANHSQSPRIAYQASMGKQSIAVTTLNYLKRFDTTSMVIMYPQQAITRTDIVNVLECNEMTTGQVTIVAIAPMDGYNQEDSIVLNRASIERGLFQIISYKTLTIEATRRGNSDFDTICLPDPEGRTEGHNYDLLDEGGVVRIGSKVVPGDVVVSKKFSHLVKSSNAAERKPQRLDQSLVIKRGEDGVVDDVVDVTTHDTRIIKVKIRKLRLPEIGDKFASSTAQKGTCGMIYAQEDMPFDADGITPDLIINPHSQPSRMTINMLKAMASSLHGATMGTYEDATAFSESKLSVGDLLDSMLDDQARSSFVSTLYDGRTGEQIDGQIYMAPCYYQRLKHLVSDKLHTRIHGPLDGLTRQPVVGRSQHGGLRFGEMEKDGTIAHGCAKIVRECLLEKSDPYEMYVCRACHRIVSAPPCILCQSNDVAVKNLPYATKILIQEVLAMGVNMRIF